MLRSLIGFDWRESKAHWLLLTKFLQPSTLEDFRDSDAWTQVLREKPEKAITRFKTEGLLAEGGLNSRLEYKLTVSDLKRVLQEQGLSVSGRKADLVQRLVEADPVGAHRAVSDLTVLMCTEVGRPVAEQFREEQKKQRTETEQQVLELLRQREFKQASETVAAFEAGQVFPRGMGIDWENYDVQRDVEVLATIYSSKPAILRRMSSDCLDVLRPVAAMMHLWGQNRPRKWLPAGFETGLHMKPDVAARMILFHAWQRRQLEDYRSSNVVVGVQVQVLQDSCERCREMMGKSYGLESCPELPYEGCTHEKGCRCVYIAITKSYEKLLNEMGVHGQVGDQTSEPG